jgi:hypothetical protein
MLIIKLTFVVFYVIILYKKDKKEENKMDLLKLWKEVTKDNRKMVIENDRTARLLESVKK